LTSQRVRRRCVALAIAAAYIAPTWADDSKTTFNIPAQDLSSALRDYARQSNREILFSTDVAKGKKTAGVKASLTADDALQALLAGTGLVIARSPNGTTLVTTPDAKEASDTSGPTHAPEGAKINSQSAVAERNRDSDLAANTIDAVVVTARRTEENLQSVPISISVFNQEQLSERNVTSGADLATYTPSLTANQRFGTNNTSFSIRGAVQEARTTASVATYFADVVSLRGPGGVTAGDGAGPGMFFDLQNVQVLKGPQGTLFGRNTTGGAILLVPQKPTHELEGYLEASGGDYDLRRLQGVLNVPLTDNVRFRAGVDWQERDGYVKNLSPVGPDAFGDDNYVAARASLVVDLTPSLENYTIASYANSYGVGFSAHMDQAFPTTGPGGGNRATNYGNLAALSAARQAAAGVWSAENPYAHPSSRLTTAQIINTTTWKAIDSLTLKNIASYGELKSVVRYDPYGTYFPLGTTYVVGQGATALSFPVPARYQGALLTFATIEALPGGAVADQSTFTDELQLQGVNFDGRLTWQAGGYYEKSLPESPVGTAGNAGGVICTDVASLSCQDVLGAVQNIEGRAGTVQYNDQESTIRNVALYGQGTLNLTDQFDITAGLRYTWDETNTLAHLRLLRFPAANDPRLYCITKTGPQGPTPTSFANAIASGQAGVLAALDGACAVNSEQKSSAPTWTIGFDYKPVDRTLLYAKYDRGYRQGSTNPFGAVGAETYEPEKLDAYEAGGKFSWTGAAPGFFNVAAFYNDFKTVQVTAAFVDINRPPVITANTYVTNGSSLVKGVEVETGITLFDRLKLTAGYAFLDSELTSITTKTPQPPFNFTLPVSTVGEAMVFTPRNKVTAAVTLQLPFPESVGSVAIGANYTYTADQFSTYDRADINAGLLPSSQIVGMNLNWKSVVGSPMDLSLFATNVFNEEYVVTVNQSVSSGFISRMYGPPRMYGVRLRYNFGE
jgi:iron complex outermembrane receptor protein